MRRIDFLESPVDLSHWDFAEQFPAYDAAALILGLEPRASEDYELRVRVVTDRMELHYQAAIDRARFEMEQFNPLFDSQKEFEDRCHPLRSIELDDLLRKYDRDLDEFPVLGWIADKRKPRFENQEFSRLAIIDWLAAIGMKSVYQFDRRQPRTNTDGGALYQIEAENARLVEKVAELERQLQAATAAPQQAPQEDAAPPSSEGEQRVHRWPWGAHHTQALGLLEAAGLRFWQWFDPTDPTTAETNETVIDWLVNERGASREKARSIASLLRADGLPPGPRR